MITISVFGLFIVVLTVAVSWGIMGYQLGLERRRK